MRIRTIKPEFWTDKKVSEWDHSTRLLFIGLWSAADDHGRGSAEPARLASELFPYDLARDPRETLARLAANLARLAASCRVRLYAVDGETFYEVTNWSKHQRIDNAGKPRVPTPSEGEPVNPRETRREPPRIAAGSGNREKGSGSGSGSVSVSVAADALAGAGTVSGEQHPAEPAATPEPEPEPDTFDEFWALYPRKTSRKKAKTAWDRLTRREQAAALADLPARKQCAQWTRDGQQFIPHASTYINGKRWEDEILPNHEHTPSSHPSDAIAKRNRHVSGADATRAATIEDAKRDREFQESGQIPF